MEPIWQYVTLTVFFSLGVILHILGVGIIAAASSVKANMEKKPIGPLTSNGLFFKLLMGSFGMYLSYSLYVWSPGLLGTTILIIHWASVISLFLGQLLSAGRYPKFSVAKEVFGLMRSLLMLVLIVSYGVACL